MQPDPTQSAGAASTRSVSQWERALLAQWFAGTERTGELAIVAAYVSERSRDDPKMRNMIVIAEKARSDVAFLLHRPVGENAWILTCARTNAVLGRFRTLPEALNMIRPLRSSAEAGAAAATAHSEDRLADITQAR
jgi:hypothetical protein